MAGDRDTVHSSIRMIEWQERVRSLRTKSIQLESERNSLSVELQRTSNEVSRLGDLILKLNKTGELLRTLLDKLVLDQVKSVESVVTDGLQSIFFDQDLSFEAEVGQGRGKVEIELLIRCSNGGIDIKGPPLDTVGGGVSSMASLILRLLTLMRLKKFPVLILDETLSSLSDEYVDLAGQFLRKLSDSTGIPICLITHKASFLDHAKTSYQGQTDDTTKSLHLRKLKGA